MHFANLGRCPTIQPRCPSQRACDDVGLAWASKNNSCANGNADRQPIAGNRKAAPIPIRRGRCASLFPLAGFEMKIVKGSLEALTRSRFKVKVLRKTNLWFHCKKCDILVYFRTYKCRVDLEAKVVHECGEVLFRAPKSLRQEAEIIHPHSIRKRKVDRRNWYENYLKSGLWASIRIRVMNRDGNRCRRCFSEANVVHHKSYEDDVMSGDNDAMLVSLCFNCHRFIEFDGDKKLSLAEANIKLAS
jgi:hypothetical protein